MRKIVTISLLIFFVMTGYYIYIGKIKNGERGVLYSAGTNKVAEENKNVIKQNANISLTEVEISKHSTEDDCWIIIENKVYNLSNYAKMHPGGVEKLIKYCGKIGTEGWQTQGKPFGKMHSSMAQMMLEKFYIGEMGQNVSENSATNENTITTIPTEENNDKKKNRKYYDDDKNKEEEVDDD